MLQFSTEFNSCIKGRCCRHQQWDRRAIRYSGASETPENLPTLPTQKQTKWKSTGKAHLTHPASCRPGESSGAMGRGPLRQWAGRVGGRDAALVHPACPRTYACHLGKVASVWALCSSHLPRLQLLPSAGCLKTSVVLITDLQWTCSRQLERDWKEKTNKHGVGPRQYFEVLCPNKD